MSLCTHNGTRHRCRLHHLLVYKFWDANIKFMGLMVHCLGRLPTDLERSYYIYILDFGWQEPLGNSLRQNFTRMASLAAQNDAVVIAGTDPEVFTKEVISFHSNSELLSYSHINGRIADDLLPAILITTSHPREFQGLNESESICRKIPIDSELDRLLLIPIRNFCKSSTDVIQLVERIFRDIREQKRLSEFSVREIMHRDKYKIPTDALILQPNNNGIGVDLEESLSYPLTAYITNNITNVIDTGGGSVIGGSVITGKDFIGRDKNETKLNSDVL